MHGFVHMQENPTVPDCRAKCSSSSLNEGLQTGPGVKGRLGKRIFAIGCRGVVELLAVVQTDVKAKFVPQALS